MVTTSVSTRKDMFETPQFYGMVIFACIMLVALVGAGTYFVNRGSAKAIARTAVSMAYTGQRTVKDGFKGTGTYKTVVENSVDGVNSVTSNYLVGACVHESNTDSEFPYGGIRVQRAYMRNSDKWEYVFDVSATDESAEQVYWMMAYLEPGDILISTDNKKALIYAGWDTICDVYNSKLAATDADVGHPVFSALFVDDSDGTAAHLTEFVQDGTVYEVYRFNGVMTAGQLSKLATVLM